MMEGQTPEDPRGRLAAYRAAIDLLDAELVRLLGERFAVTERVGHLKATHDLPALDASRELEQLARLRGLAHEAGVEERLVEAIFGEIMRTVRRRHDELRSPTTSNGAGTNEAAGSGSPPPKNPAS
jgi:chorismate mutase